MSQQSPSADTRAHELRDSRHSSQRTLHDYFVAALRCAPDKIAIVDTSADPRRRISYRELDALCEKIGASLTRLGVERGDVVPVQLPNCWQHLALALACARIGAVINPLMPIFRERELEFMLNLCESKVLVVPAIWRGREHAAMVRALRPQLPHLRHLIVLGEAGVDGFERQLLRADAADDRSTAKASPLTADELALVMFTSGTTGEPKGVMHSSTTLLSTLDAALHSLEMSPRDVVLCSAPMGHMVGFALLGMFPLMAKATIVIMDAWKVDAALRCLFDEGVTFMAGPTPYLADLCDAVAAGGTRPSAVRVFCCAGAPIPPVLVERADQELNMTVCSLWGMTEVQAGTVTAVADGRRYSALADGRPPPGMQILIVDDDRKPVPIGVTGRLLVRGSGVFVGYLKRPELSDEDADGWFDTGDLAYVVDDRGFIRINGRSKDIIKRGGESVPVVEVEALLARHPAVAGVAIVGWPDDRLGERVCAFVVLRPGESLTLDTMREYLRSCRLTPQYWPERLEYVDDLPRTASGKVQKFRLREIVRTRTAA